MVSHERFIYYGRYVALAVFISTLMFAALRATIFAPLAILPPVIILGAAAYLRRQSIAGFEEQFSYFLNDLKDLLQGGMPLVSALEVISTHNYGKFTSFVHRLTAQSKLGIDFEKALLSTAGEIDSPIIRKTAFVIAETHRRGGNLISVFNATSKYVTEIERLRARRRSVTYASMFQSYLMFFIFLGIVLAIQAFFLPLIQQTTVFQTTVSQPINFNQFFLYLLVIQGLFAGPMIGKISENSLLAGLRHSVVLLSVSLPVYIISTAIFIPTV